MKPCCSLRLVLRGFTEQAGGPRFTCLKCGQSYLRRDWQWQPIKTADDIRDMMEQEHARQTALGLAEIPEGVIVPQGGSVALEGTATKDEGAAIHGQLAINKGGVTAGVEGGISQKKGWGVSGFLKWVWGK
jgi:hypothetical protein